MNERIRELAEQAIANVRFWNAEKESYDVGHDELEKFAELIVQECIKQIAMSSVCFTADQVRIKNMTTNCIKKHFGVEE